MAAASESTALVHLDVREIPREALVLDPPRSLRRLARDSELIKRRLQVLHHAGAAKTGISPKDASAASVSWIGLRSGAMRLEPSEARLLDLAGPSLRAEAAPSSRPSSSISFV